MQLSKAMKHSEQATELSMQKDTHVTSQVQHVSDVNSLFHGSSVNSKIILLPPLSICLEGNNVRYQPSLTEDFKFSVSLINYCNKHV